MDLLTRYRTNRREDRGELRLVALVDKEDGHFPGQSIEPEVNRRRGFTTLTAHLEYGPTPGASDPEYSTAPVVDFPPDPPVSNPNPPPAADRGTGSP